MKKRATDPIGTLAEWKKPELTNIDLDVIDVAAAMNPGSDAGNGRSSSGS